VQPDRDAIRDFLARYCRDVDRMRWATEHRIFLNDWLTFVPVPEAATSPLTGRRDTNDPSYAAFAELTRDGTR
jgi:hypothetical protein